MYVSSQRMRFVTAFEGIFTAINLAVRFIRFYVRSRFTIYTLIASNKFSKLMYYTENNFIISANYEESAQ